MTTKTMNKAVLAFAAIASLATAASSPASANGHHFGGSHGSFSGSGLSRPVHGVGSSHNPIPVRSLPNQSIGTGTGTLLPGPTSGPKPVSFPSSPFRNQIGKGLPWLLSGDPKTGDPKKGNPEHGGPEHGGPDRGWGGPGYGRGLAAVGGVIVVPGAVAGVGADVGPVVCGKHLHWSPHFNRCIPNYV